MSGSQSAGAILEVQDLTVEFNVAAQSWGRNSERLRAVDHVSLGVGPGEVLGLVGESGCGKTTLGRAIVGLYKPSSGLVRFKGRDVHAMRGGDLMTFRREVQIVFQDPYASLNPRMTVQEIVREPLRTHRVGSRADQLRRVEEVLELVGVSREAMGLYPHAFSGGQRQRIGIARALALGPELIVADEPVSALDVSIQAQVVNLIAEIQDTLGLAVIFIAHDLAVVRQVARRIAVMYLGTIVETGDREDIFDTPAHPYTRALLSAIPRPDPARERHRTRLSVSGDVPSPIDLPSGCRFHTRCPIAMEICRTVAPEPLPVLSTTPSHIAACHAVEAHNQGEPWKDSAAASPIKGVDSQ